MSVVELALLQRLNRRQVMQQIDEVDEDFIIIPSVKAETSLLSSLSQAYGEDPAANPTVDLDSPSEFVLFGRSS